MLPTPMLRHLHAAIIQQLINLNFYGITTQAGVELYQSMNVDIQITKPNLECYKDLKGQYRGDSNDTQCGPKAIDIRRIELQNDGISVMVKGNYEENQIKNISKIM